MPLVTLSDRTWLASILVSLATLAGACAGEQADSDSIGDDVNFGDSLPGGKADGYTVPGSLGLDKQGILYLTFDDGPSRKNTPLILDTLASRGLPATFFVNGANIAGKEDLLARMAGEGHFVGNHQWKHDIAQTGSEFRSWVTNTRDAIAAACGEMPLFFRFPFGATAPWREAILQEEGYLDGGIGWDIDSLDWDFGVDEHSSRAEVPPAYRDDFAGWILLQAQQRGGGVALFHDVQSITAARLDAILDRLQAEGFLFGALPLERTPVTPGGFVGDPCAAEEDCDFAGAFCLAGADEPGGLCTKACTSTCPDRAGYQLTRCVRAPDDSGAAMDLCAVTCGESCREGTTCTELPSPAGAARDVCWTPRVTPAQPEEPQREPPEITTQPRHQLGQTPLPPAQPPGESAPQTDDEPQTEDEPQ